MTNKTITISRETFQGLLEGIAYGGYDNNSRLDMFHRVLGEPWETVTMCEADARLLLCGFSYVNEHREELLAALRRAEEKEHSDHIAAEFEREGRKLPPGFYNCTAEKAVTGIFIPPADPVPPAGVDPEVVATVCGAGWNSKGGTEWMEIGVKTMPLDRHVETGAELIFHEDHREHVTRLQAEVERRDSKIDTMRRKNNELNDTVATLQSELTKALELLEHAEGAIPGGGEWQWLLDRIAALHTNQSAPADQNSDWEDTFGPDYEVDENDLARGVSETDNLLPVRDGYCQCGRLVHRPQINQSAPADKGGDS